MTTENTQLVILDIQGKLSQIVYQSEEVLRNSTILIEGCKHLELPIVWVEQMPDKLGVTHPAIAELLSSKTPVKKVAFQLGIILIFSNNSQLINAKEYCL